MNHQPKGEMMDEGKKNSDVSSNTQNAIADVIDFYQKYLRTECGPQGYHDCIDGMGICVWCEFEERLESLKNASAELAKTEVGG